MSKSPISNPSTLISNRNSLTTCLEAHSGNILQLIHLRFGGVCSAVFDSAVCFGGGCHMCLNIHCQISDSAVNFEFGGGCTDSAVHVQGKLKIWRWMLKIWRWMFIAPNFFDIHCRNSAVAILWDVKVAPREHRRAERDGLT